jgi:hypothetical protein
MSKLQNIFIKNNEYQINDVIYHRGATVNSGHYVCHSFRKKNWIIYNDNDTTRMSGNIGGTNYQTPSSLSEYSPTTILLRRTKKLSLQSKSLQDYIDNVIERIISIFRYINYNFILVDIANLSGTTNPFIQEKKQIDRNNIPYYIDGIVGVTYGNCIEIKKSMLLKLYILINEINKKNRSKTIDPTQFTTDIIKFIFKTKPLDHNQRLDKSIINIVNRGSKVFKNVTGTFKSQYVEDNFIVMPFTS